MTKLTSTNPGKGYEVIGEVEISTEREIAAKVAKANAAKVGWQGLGISKRVELLRTLHNKFLEDKEKLALLATREMGMPISQSRNDIDAGLNYFQWYLNNAEKYLGSEVSYEDDKTQHTVYHEPYGVAGVIVPWNFPFSNFIWGVGQNLVAGNTVVFKHSEECPLFGKAIENLVATCSLPEGVFGEVYGDGKVGDYLAHQNINSISFTGSTATGRSLYKIAAERLIHILLELGGSAPGIVFEDAELGNVVATLYFNRFINCGQACDAMKRLIVHESRFEEVVNTLKEYVEGRKGGDPADEGTDIGPLVAKRQLDTLISQVEDAVSKGAKIITGGRVPKDLKGAYYLPTLLTNITSEMRIWHEEVFGPVLPIVSFKSGKEAIKLANDTRYGLGAYVFTKDKAKALRVAQSIEAGMVSVNNATYLQPCSPFGGYKESGIGREHGKYGFGDVSQIKVVATEK